ncbi:hypothetical protein BVI434_180035 [Burkholderia vietnamiensis]|nr:hypothetical protein BVI434_180035 [Burkholderia vietnamiensis]
MRRSVALPADAGTLVIDVRALLS